MSPDQRENTRSPSADSLVQAAYALEPLPQSLTRLASLVADEGTQLRELVEVVTLDPALTGALLRRANSALSASMKPIATVQEAVVRLGMGMVLSLAICSHLHRLTRGGGLGGLGAGSNELWNHSVAASIAAEVVRARSALELPPETSTAALLHDIGRLVIERFVSKDTAAFVQKARELEGASRLQAEISVLGTHHAELGARVVERWGLPLSIAAGIRFHHTPAEGSRPIAWAVALANLLAHDVVAAAASKAPEPGSAPAGQRAECLAALRIPADAFTALVAEIARRYEQTKVRFLG